MICNQWYVILESREVGKTGLVGIERFGERLVIWRSKNGSLSCFKDVCPHRGAALSAGKIFDDTLQCPFHGFTFDHEGTCTCVPANGKAAQVPKAMRAVRIPVRESHGFIYAWYGETEPVTYDLPWFESLREERFSFSTLRETWNTHYSRAIENQLDVVHLPFVHHNTIGRGFRTLVNGPYLEWDEDSNGSHQLNIWVFNEFDQGQKPKRIGEIARPDLRPFLQFRFPNIWHNWISDGLRVFAAFVPVNENQTIMYIRQYQAVVKAPFLKDAVNALGKLGNWFILNQDKRVVVTQRPLRTEVKMDEKLIPGDGPIIEYRRRRQELQKCA
jgi:phenylpropionate dioxygenase-like ring-hydroxylating dioxygenase large terminal subunit